MLVRSYDIASCACTSNILAILLLALESADIGPYAKAAPTDISLLAVVCLGQDIEGSPLALFMHMYC